MDLMMLPEFVKLALFMLAVFISNIVQALTGFAGVMLSIPPTILLYGPDMAKAVINAICWLVCALLMYQNRQYINPKELLRIVVFMLVGMAIGESPDSGTSLRRHYRRGSAEEPHFQTERFRPAELDRHPCTSGGRRHSWHVCFRRCPAGGIPGRYLPG